MQNKIEKSVHETEAAFALAIVLLNILVLASVGGLIWLLQSIMTLNSPLGMILRETALR